MTTKQITGEFTVTLAPIEGYAHGQQGVNLGSFQGCGWQIQPRHRHR